MHTCIHNLPARRRAPGGGTDPSARVVLLLGWNGIGVLYFCSETFSMLCMIPGLAAMTLSAGPTPMQMSYAKAFM